MFSSGVLFTHNGYQSVLEHLMATWNKQAKRADTMKAEAQRKELVKNMVEQKDDDSKKLGVGAEHSRK